MREQRFNANVQIRAQRSAGKDSPGRLVGYAAVFMPARSEDLGGFVEQIDPHAFDKSLRNGDDVKALINHAPSLLIGRTQAGTLRLSTDRVGLRMDCDLPNTSYAKDLFENIKVGNLTEMSFAFQVDPDGDAWADEGDLAVRTLRSVRLLDVSCVVSPAYPATSVGISEANSVPPELVMGRSLWPEGIPTEVRSKVPQLQSARERRQRFTDLILGI